MIINYAFLFFYGITILLHLYFAVLEMVFWKTRARKVFRTTQEYADTTAKLASNQGLYNLFLAVALVIGFIAPYDVVSHAFILYGLSCVIVAGIWGGITVNKRITLVQALPAAIALVLYLI